MIQPIKVSAGYPFGATPYPLRIINLDGTVFGWKHGGQDYPAPTGTVIYAPHSGTVTIAGSNGSAGIEVRIAKAPYVSRLLHLSRVVVSVGQVVNQGQVIGYSGNTGYTTGPHLHWGLSVNGKYQNPLLYVTPPKPPAPSFSMPAIGSVVKFSVPRTAFVAGTTTVKGTLAPDNRIVRGYDPKYPNRILVNSASVGQGVAVALFYTNGSRIAGWTV